MPLTVGAWITIIAWSALWWQALHAAVRSAYALVKAAASFAAGDLSGIARIEVMLFGSLADTAGNALSRYQENQADVYSLEINHGIVADPGQAMAHAFQKFGETVPRRQQILQGLEGQLTPMAAHQRGKQ